MSFLSLSAAALALVAMTGSAVVDAAAFPTAHLTPTFGTKAGRRSTFSNKPVLAPHHIHTTERAQTHLNEMKTNMKTKNAHRAAATAGVAPNPVLGYSAAALADQIKSLPGLVDEISFNQFSGYLPADATGEKFLHYWFVESQSEPSVDPLFWWTNGGPGCSGLIGFFEEHGPFRVQPDGKTVLLNPYSWNKISNVIYIEAPVGVGFSYSNNATDYTYANDAITAAQNYVALENFFLRFPMYGETPLYLSGESYGGHYVPQLAGQFIDHGNVATLAGVFIGNPYIDSFSNEMFGTNFMLYGHALTDLDSWNAIQEHCIKPFLAAPTTFKWYNNVDCVNADNAIGFLDFPAYYGIDAPTIDPYGLNYPYCSLVEQQRERAFFDTHKAVILGADQDTRDMLGITQVVGVNATDINFVACLANFVTAYLQRPDVLAAINVDRTKTLGGVWQPCAAAIEAGVGAYEINDYYGSVEQAYQKLFNNKINTVIFSGDDDTVCGTIGTQWILNNFQLMGGDRNLTATSKWMSWDNQFERDQIGGFVQAFDFVTLVTVHGAGHEVSFYQPERGYAVFEKLLQGAWAQTGTVNNVAVGSGIRNGKEPGVVATNTPDEVTPPRLF